MFVIRFFINRNEYGELEDIQFLELRSMCEPFHCSHLEELYRINDVEYQSEFISLVNLKRAIVVDINVDFIFESEYPAYCSKIVNVINSYPESSFVQEIGFAWDDMQSEDEIPF